MELKERLALYRAQKKYERYPGIKSFKIVLDNELTANESSIIESIKKIDSSCDDRIALECERFSMVDWAKEKLLPCLDYESEIIVNGIGGIALYFDDIEVFLKHYYEESCTLDIIIINRNLRRCVAILEGEFFLEYFNKAV